MHSYTIPNRSHKCKWCKRYIGSTFDKFPEGVIDDGENYFCGVVCDTLFWLNGWGNCHHRNDCAVDNKLTDFGRGYKQACRETYDRIKRYALSEDQVAEKGAEDE